KIHFAKSAVASGHYARCLSFLFVVKTSNPRRRNDWNISLNAICFRKIVASLQSETFAERFPFPPLRHALGDAGVFVAREPEADEPFLVELPGRLLQQRHPP